jgi:integrase
MPKREYGAGSIYQRASDGRWVGSILSGWTAGGTRRRITVTCKATGDDERDRKTIQRLLRDKRLELDRGETGLNPRTTVKSWADVWLARTQNEVRPKTWATNRSCINLWVIPTIGHKRLTALTPGDVRAVTDAIRAAGRTSSTALRCQVVLERMLADAVREGHQIQQRVLMVNAPGKSVSDRDAIFYEHATELLKVAGDSERTPDGSRWVAALLQGMRQGECLGLTWACVNFATATLDVSWQLQALPYVSGRSGPFRVPDGYEYRQLDGALCLVRPKSRAGHRVIPLTTWMMRSLMLWDQVSRGNPNPHGLVWPAADGRPRTSKQDSAAWKALQVEAHVSGPGRAYLLHEARHSTATLLLDGGTDPATVTAIMGHSSIVSTRPYQHVSNNLALTALEGIAKRLELT